MPTTDAELAFEDWLHATFGPLPPLDLGPMSRIGPTAWASPATSGALPIVPEFREEPGDYVLAGHWGRGGSSEAVYLIERRGEHRAFLRLPWGGFYADPARDAARVREAIAAWAVLRRALPLRLAASEVVSNMQTDRALLRWPDGREEEVLGPTPLATERGPFWPALVRIVGG